MKQIWEEIGLALILGILIPGILLHLAVDFKQKDRVRPMLEEETIGNDDNRTVRVMMNDGTTELMDLEAYIAGVVLAEMPASFEKEALKAQAVVARTYTLRAENGKSKHEEAAVCTQSDCCQAYRSLDDYLADGGNWENYEKVRRAVEKTRGEVLLYDGELIEATYFSCSGGSTEDAMAVWGADIPYLQAVESPGEEHAAYFEDEQIFTREEICNRLEIEAWNGELFEKMTYTSGGGVDIASVCGRDYTGTVLRKLLQLRSTSFTVTENENTVIFHTRGFGHRVGMSQYGADAMALEGHTYPEILAHYYRGTELALLTD